MTITLVFAVANLFEKANRRDVIWKEFPVVPSAVAASTPCFPSAEAERQACILVRSKKKLHRRKNSPTLWASQITEIQEVLKCCKSSK